MRRLVAGGAAAGMLPAALLVSLLCSAPFAGTTTAPLAGEAQVESATGQAVAQGTVQATTAAPAHDAPGWGAGALIAGEALLGAVGAGVVLTVARRDARRGRARRG